MAGIYLHIPFCRQKCHYCNFYSLASLKYKDDFLHALFSEIEIQKEYLGKENVDTLYFGGGTPSLLSDGELNNILETLHRYFNIDEQAEITLEANPDDLDRPRLKEIISTPVNRLSIGIQSFYDEDLHYLHRVHDAEQARRCIDQAKEAGFENLTIDLIYGIPTLTNEHWMNNLATFDSFDLPHLSAYALTVEPHTALDTRIRKGKMKPVEEDKIVAHFEALMDFAGANHFLHYEISNFCREPHFSKHNTSYWQGKKYLGLGPSAHSYDQHTRQWNIASVKKYIESIQKGILPAEKEILSPEQKYNEYVMLSIRTVWGIDPDYIQNRFSSKIASHFKEAINKLYLSDLVQIKGMNYTLTRQGKLFADRIASHLFL